MIAYRIETVVPPDGEIKLNSLPFHPGEAVEVIILARTDLASESPHFPLQDSVLMYEDPTEPVAENDWDALQ
jgi:hypothetical protein